MKHFEILSPSSNNNDDINNSSHSIKSTTSFNPLSQGNHLISIESDEVYPLEFNNTYKSHILRFYLLYPQLSIFLMTFIFCCFPLILTLILLSPYSYINSINTINTSSSNSNDNSNIFQPFEVTSSYGAVATDSEICSQIGVNILKKGGNAIDAAISSKLCLGVVSPASSGIGGGCYILIHNESLPITHPKKNVFIDSREIAPNASTFDMFVNNPLQAQNGALAIAIPGELKGLYHAYQSYGSGKISWKDLVEPAAILADEWIVSYELEVYLKSEAKYLLNTNQFPELTSIFTKDGLGNELKVRGDIVNQPKLATFLRNIGEKTPSFFYHDLASILGKYKYLSFI